MCVCVCVCVCVYVHACVCVSSLYSSGSDITKCGIVPNSCGCLSQHIQTLTPTPGNPFINTPSLCCLGFDTLHWDTPMCRYSPCSTQTLNVHTKLSHPHPCIHSSPCLASDFLQQIRGFVDFLFSGLRFLLCKPGQPPI